MADWYDTLYAEGLISDESFEKIRQKPNLFSVLWELRTLLYLGVLLLTSGLGVLVYENIDTIGHQVVLLIIALLCAGCFVYCCKTALPFNTVKVKAPNTAFDYVLLLGSISFLTLIGYLQFEYKVFGSNYGLVTLLPMLVLFFLAYYFDHLGILHMAIANLAVWMGVSVTPKALLLNSDFDRETIIYTYLTLGAVLLTGAYLTQRSAIKKHFKFSYQHDGVHVTFIALLGGYFHYYDAVICALWVAAFFAVAFFVYMDSLKRKSFYFLLLVILYSYIALSSLIVRLMVFGDHIVLIYIMMLYFIGSAIGLLILLINLNKRIKAA